MNGKLLGRLAFRGWRDGTRADRRWARGWDERLWQRDADDQMAPPEVGPDMPPYQDLVGAAAWTLQGGLGEEGAGTPLTQPVRLTYPEGTGKPAR